MIPTLRIFTDAVCGLCVPEHGWHAVQVTTLAAGRGHRSATSADGLPPIGAATADSPRGPRPLVLALASLGQMAGRLGLCSARDRDRLATQALPRSLEAYQSMRQAGPIGD